MSDFEPILFRKGSVTRQATSPSDAVSLRFEGFREVDAAETPRQALQARAKELGIDARLSNTKLEAAIAEAEDDTPSGSDDEPESPLDGDGPAVELNEQSPLSGGDDADDES